MSCGKILIKDDVLLCFHAAYIRTVASVDFDEFAFVDEQRHTHGGAGFNGCWLEGVGCGVALEAWLGVCDFEHCLDRHFGIKHGFG